MSGVNFLFQVNAKQIEDHEIHFVKTELIQKEGERRPVPIEIPNSKFAIDADYVIMAIGSKLGEDSYKLDLNEKGYIKVNEKYETNDSKIFACGDCIGQNATVAWASRSGREVAKLILNN